MFIPNNVVSNQFCFSLDNYLPYFCTSIQGFNRGVGLTSEPSFASLQLTFLIICNLFYLNIFVKVFMKS